MPLLGLGKQRLDPDLALAQRLLVCGGRLVGSHPLQVLLAEGAPDGAPRLGAGRAVGPEGTGTAGRSPRAVEDALLGLGGVRAAQHLAVRAHIVVLHGVVGEFGGAEIGAVLLPVGQGDVSTDAHVFHRSDVRNGPVLGVASHLPRPQLPAEARPPQQIEHRLVLHHLAGGHQHPHNDAAFAAIDDIVRLVAQMSSAALEAHRRGVGIGRADTQISSALVDATHLTLLATFLGDPVVARGVCLGQLFAHCGRQIYRQGRGWWGRGWPAPG